MGLDMTERFSLGRNRNEILTWFGYSLGVVESRTTGVQFPTSTLGFQYSEL